MQQLTADLEEHDYAYVTTRGRISGQPHRIEIWFVVIDGAVWLNSGGRDRSDWVQNLIADPTVHLEIGARTWSARAVRHADLKVHPARARLPDRYQRRRPGEPLSDWARDGLLIEIVVTDDA